MSRIITKAMAATAVLGLAGTAFGQAAIEVGAPDINGDEAIAVSPDFTVPTILRVDFAAGLNADGFMDGNVSFVAEFFTIAADGTVTDLADAFDVNIPDAQVDENNDSSFGDTYTYANATPAEILLDLPNVVGFANGVAQANAAAPAGGAGGFRIVATSAGGGTAVTEDPTAIANGLFNASAESPRIIPATDPFRIEDAFFTNDSGGGTDTFVVEFSHPTNQGSDAVLSTAANGANEINQTVSDDPGADPIDVAEGGNQLVDEETFQFSVMGDFSDAVNVAANAFTSAEIFGSNNTLIRIVDAEGEFTAGIGNTIRVNTMDIRDIYGRTLDPADEDNNRAVVGAPASLTLVSAESFMVAPAEMDASDALATEALRFTFSNPIVDIPANDVFTLMINGAATTFAAIGLDEDNNDADGEIETGIADAAGDVSAIADPADSNSIIVEFLSISDATDDGLGIGPDGREVTLPGSDNGLFMVTVGDSAFQDVTDIFGNSITTDNTVNLEDGIAPTAQAGARFFDCDGDGTVDGVGFVFDEPVTGTDAGVTLSKIDMAAVFPFGQIEADGTLVMDEVSGTDEISITGTELNSTDLDADGIETLEMNNTIIFKFDPFDEDWDGDGMTLTSDPADEDGEATPDTGNDAVNIAVDASSDIADGSGNGVGTTFDEAADGDLAPPALFASFHNDSEAIVAGDDDNLRCFAEDASGAADDRAILIFGEVITGPPSVADLGLGITIDGDRLNLGGNPSDAFFDDTLATNNVLTILDSTLNDADGLPFAVNTNANILDGAGNEFIGNGTLTSNTLPYLPIQSASMNFAAFPIDDDAPGDAGFGFADRFFLLMSGPLDMATVDMADASDFTIAGTTNTIGSIELDSGNPSVLILNVAETGADQDISIDAMTNITYNGSTASTLITGDAKNSMFIAEEPVEPDVETETPFTMDITGVLTDNGNPLPIGTEICAMIAVPTVRSITAEKNGLTFRYDLSDLDQVEAVTLGSGSDDAIKRSLENFTNFILGLEERLYLLCDSNGVDMYSNTKFGLNKDNTSNDVSSLTSIDLDVNSSRLSSITFAGRTGSDTVARGTVRLVYDVLRATSNDLGSLINQGYCIKGAPIVSETVITSTDGSFGLHVSLPNLEASDSDDGLSNDANVFATQPLPIIMMAKLVDGTFLPLSSLVTNAATFDGPILFSAEALTQNSDGSATGATVFNADIANIGTRAVYDGYNMIPFYRASGFAESSSEVPVLPNGHTFDSDGDPENLVVGDPLLPSAGPEDQFVWSCGSDFSSLSDIVVDAEAVQAFPFILSSEGVQFGTRGITNLVGGYSLGFGNFSGGQMTVAQFGPMLPENASIFTSDDPFPNNSTTRGWVSATFSGPDDTTMSDFFLNNAGADYVIHFNRTADDMVEVGSAGFGVSSTDDLDSVSTGDALIIHYNGSN